MRCPSFAMSRRGFSLIELMSVVASIGILAAVAIANFLKFQSRAKQAEAKSNLGNSDVMMVAGVPFNTYNDVDCDL